MDNADTASHMGGVWERMIRSVRKVLASIVREQVNFSATVKPNFTQSLKNCSLC